MHTRIRFTRLVVLMALAGGALLTSPYYRRVAAVEAVRAPSPNAVKRPLAFERNDGQHDAAIRYAARGPGYSVSMLDTGVALAVRGGDGPPSRVTMRFGRARTTSPTAETPLEGSANYFIGDSRGWHTDIPTFGGVRYKNAFDGIDLVFYGADQQLEYDVVVAPGADPRAARITFDGAASVRVDRDGTLVLRTAARDLRYSKPVAYQLVGAGRRQIDVSYRVKGSSILFEAGAYDRTRPLVIDPVLRFSTYLGGTFSDSPTAVAVDAAGNTYVTGYTDSLNFPVTAGAPQPSNPAPDVDAFVTKLSPAGAIVYSTYLGGSVGRDDPRYTPDQGYGIAADAAGYAYVTGWTACADFPVTPGAFQTSARGDLDVFVTKLSASGNRLTYSTYLGGARQDVVSNGTIAVDMLGFAYVGGITNSLDFPTTPGVIDASNPAGDQTGFVVKLNQAGSGLVYGTYLTGAQQSVQGLALEESGDVVVTGSVLYSMQTSTGPSSSLGDWDAYLFRLNPKATASWSRRIGGKGHDFAEAVAIGHDGTVYVAGSTGSPDLPVRPSGRHLIAGDTDALFMRLSPGFELIFDAAYIGGSATDVARAISVDGWWKVTLAGTTSSTDFPVVRPIQARNAGGIDAFVMQFSFGNAASPSFSTYLGGSQFDAAFGAAVDGTGAVTVVGDTDSMNFPIRNAAQPTNAAENSMEGFVTRIAEAERDALGPGDVVVHVGTAATLHGNWFAADDAAAASGVRLHNPDAGAPKVTTPSANPNDYFEFTVNLQPQTRYRMWIRALAQGNSFANDSVWVQLSNASNGAYEEAEYEELYRIGTTNAMAVTLEDCQNCLVRGWGWQDGGWGLNRLGPTFYVDSSVTTVRVQRREDGISIDQIVLVPAYEGSSSPYVQAAPGYQKDDTTILPAASPPGVDRDIVLYPVIDGARLHGAWRTVADGTAAGGARVWHPDAGAAKLAAPLASPVNYFDLNFHAQAGVGYRLWIRGTADANHWANDSAFVQFSSSVTASGLPVWQIGTTSATTYVLEDCSGCTISGWGWNDNEYGSAKGPLVYFANTGEQAVRIQTREDGLSIDQIVLSPRTYMDRPPGATQNDTTIVSR